MARTSKAPNAIVKYYLLAYNVVACLGWSYILITLITHILSSTAPPPANQKTSNILTRLVSSIPYLQSTPQVGLNLHPYLAPYLKRATTAFDKVGETTAWVQTLAILEIIHAALGLVRSPLGTTAMQVFSRLALVWGIAEHYKVVRPHPVLLLAITKFDYYKGTYKPPIRIDGPRVVFNGSSSLRFLRHLPPLAPPLPPPLLPLHDFLPPLPPRRRLRSLLDLLYPASLGRGRLDGGGLW